MGLVKNQKKKDHGIWSHHFMANRWRNNGNSERLYFVAPKSLQMVIAAMKLKKQKQKQKQKTLLLERKAMTNLDSILKAETLPCQQRSI